MHRLRGEWSKNIHISKMDVFGEKKIQTAFDPPPHPHFEIPHQGFFVNMH